jgi:hypothetical protein
MTDETRVGSDGAWDGGFVCGLLTARYYALRHAMSDEFFRSAVPTHTPEVVYALVSQMSRASVDHKLFETSWASLDHLLLCESTDELMRALALAPDYRLQ